jgi:hypothetical protein
MDKREFVQRYVIENYYDGGNVYHDIATAIDVFSAIEEKFAEGVNSIDLWSIKEG